MLRDQIFKTLQYFDVQNHPLTLLEIYKYLLAGETADIKKILNVLETDLKNQVQTANGFYFLKGREEIANQRLENNLYATPRLKRAKKYLPGTRHVPFVKAVALTGSEAINNSKQGSDIDLLVLTEPNRIWLARLFLTAYFQLFGVRRYGSKVADRFCLNHYVEAGKKLNREQHLYTAVEYVSLIPFFGGREIHEFQQANLDWIKGYLAQPSFVEYETVKPSAFKKVWEYLLNGKLGNILENIFGKLQTKKIKIQDSIVIEKDELSFHPGNKGRQVLSRINF